MNDVQSKYEALLDFLQVFVRGKASFKELKERVKQEQETLAQKGEQTEFESLFCDVNDN